MAVRNALETPVKIILAAAVLTLVMLISAAVSLIEMTETERVRQEVSESVPLAAESLARPAART